MVRDQTPDGLTREDVERAAQDIDNTSEQFNESTTYDVVIGSRRYPPKPILSIAGERILGRRLSMSEIRGDRSSRGFRILESLGFPITKKVDDVSFEVGRIYHRQNELHARFGGQQQGGISTPKNASFVMLFTGEIGKRYGYEDGWTEDGVFVLFGEGQNGDMSFKAGNLAVRNHADDGKSLHLFESLGAKSRYRYVGEFVCSSFEWRDGVDQGGSSRKVIAFHLVQLGAGSEAQLDEEIEELDLQALRSQAFAASSTGEQHVREARVAIYRRSETVRQYVLRRADGVCESCKQPAPFNKISGEPYLEPHHTRRLSDDGPDCPRWVGAVCPTCHREIHHGEHGSLRNDELKAYLGELEDKE